MDNEKSICSHCTYCLNGRCNRLVFSGGFGRNDRLGSYYKKGNDCPYHREGEPKKREVISNYTLNGWNS